MNTKLKTKFKNARAPFVAACAALSVGVLPALAAPSAATQPPTSNRGAASTPAKSGASPYLYPDLAITNLKVAAQVGDEQITMDDINRMVDDVIVSQPEIAVNTPQNKALIKQMRLDLLDNMISQRLMYQEARRKNLLPTEQEVNDTLWNFQKSFSSEVTFNRWLTDEGKTIDDLKELFRRRLAVEKLKNALVSEITVTDPDMNAFYEAHKADMTVPDTVEARQIQFSFPTDHDAQGNIVVKTMTDADKKKLMQKATGVLKKAQSDGTDFAVLAQQNSDDPDSKSNGGDLGTLTPEDVIDPIFRDALFSAPVGKVYPKLVETKVGYHIIKVDDKKPGRVLGMTEVSAKMKPQVLAQKADAAVKAEVVELRAKAKITNYLKDSNQ